jgi:hypothetical protein
VAVDPVLVEHLREQLSFMEASAAAYDRGLEGEAKRLATVLRVLLHDTPASTSVLGQLAVKDDLLFADTALHPPSGALLVGPRLLMMQMTTGPQGGGKYVPPLGDGPPDRYINPPIPFDKWWNSVVLDARDETTFTRKQLVLTTAGEAEPTAFAGDAALASVRQIAYEVEISLRGELPHLLGDS